MKKWFRVATEGASTDGRKITREWLTQMAESYDQEKYGARIWMEHLRGLFHDGPFKALGDVTGVEAREVEDGKLALFAELHPTDALVQMNTARQKVYTSIEVDPDFAGSGKAYMVGIAVTDSPASLGTELLQFSASKGAASPLAARKVRPENLFTAGEETVLDFTAAEQDGPTLTEQVKAFFERHRTAGKEKFTAFRAELEDSLGAIVEQIAALEDNVNGQPDPGTFAELQKALGEQTTELADLKAAIAAFTGRLEHLEAHPDTPPRTPALGGTGQELGAF